MPKTITTFPKIIKQKQLLNCCPPDLTHLWSDVLYLRWVSLLNFEGLVIQEVFSNNFIETKDDTIQEARIAALNVIDSLTFPKAVLVAHTMKKVLLKKRVKNKNFHQKHNATELFWVQDENSTEEEIISILAKRQNEEILKTKENEIKEISTLMFLCIESNFIEGILFLKGQNIKLSKPIKGAFRFLIIYQRIIEMK